MKARGRQLNSSSGNSPWNWRKGTNLQKFVRLSIPVVVVTLAVALVIALQNNSNSSVSLQAARSIDGLIIQVPRGWPIINSHSCSLPESSVLTNVPADWRNVQCPDNGTRFETTIRIGHFNLKSGCCVSSIEVNIGGKSSIELRYSNGLIYGVEWHNPEVSIQFDYSPYVHMSPTEVERDRAQIGAVLNSIHAI